jgi:NAD(P)-dependent dehydrogenase (short-subunit alcohol dehydrogenase family)
VPGALDSKEDQQMPVDLQGRVAVVTGTGAIGGAVVAALAGSGADVAVWDRSASALAEVADTAASLHEVDVRDEQDVARVAALTVENHGGVDILVNSAAVATFAPVETMDLAMWRETIDVNLTGVFLVCRALIAPMAARGGGSIINFASIGGLRGEPEYSHYCASKFGVIGFSQSLAREVGDRGIRVNAVAPGAIASPMNTVTMERDARRLGTSVESIEERIVQRVSLRRIGAPADVARVVLFLASDLSGYVSGETVSITGGVF